MIFLNIDDDQVTKSVFKLASFFPSRSLYHSWFHTLLLFPRSDPPPLLVSLIVSGQLGFGHKIP